MRTIQFKAMEHETVHNALTELNFSGEVAISLAGRHFTLSRSELDRIEGLGIQPTIWTWNDASGRFISIPGKH